MSRSWARPRAAYGLRDYLSRSDLEAVRLDMIDLGLALDDMAVAPEPVLRALAAGIGTWLPL